MNERYQKDESKEFDAENFKFRDEEFPLFDLWGLATKHLLNNATYKKQCLNNEMLTASGTFFKTSAEATFRYLMQKYDFNEAHTALDDATIETYILSKIAQRSAITIGIMFFPFRELGTTDEFVMRLKKPNQDEVSVVIEAIEKYLDNKEQSNYTARLENIISRLTEYLTK
jgi:predicted ribosome quality control (RQC) complex YloA/Tae2 family protein